ncbi:MULTISPECIES: N-acetylglucosamine-6-phosphate deacetylase [unclassified Paenibacillus]|uniref:N-acetylglucosamine-6-phosphate deacetylase n=1 Tax=unclassified Paenibacillus TaxID=185978 RepID=UPI001E4C63CC|nr:MULTISPECIES: amidohydrolase family protein [unclassified Paenibacillus]CAH0120180.1 N-acetylglucosamine-6-phosphate deacetylase [Paenibacillus sp. CECT 9249]
MMEHSRIRAIHYRTGRPVSILIQSGKIGRMEYVDESDDRLPWIAPGLVDLQVNGYRGMDFNTLPIEDGMPRRITHALWEEGVTSYLPTVITNRGEAIEEAVSAIARACRADDDTNRAVAGIHLEGPFISPEDGPRGAHNREFVRPPDWNLFQRWQEAADGKIKIVTMSPEWPNATEFIRKCADSGVIVSIGHTAASDEQIRAAVGAGARMSTHLGNGAHLTLPRHPNYIWEQLAQDRLWACMIGDGFHLPDSVMKVIMRVKGDQAILVSDAVQLAGMPAGPYRLHIGGDVVLTPAGRLHLADRPELLAGSAQMLLKGVEHVAGMEVIPFPDVWDMASVRPKTLLHAADSEGLVQGAEADFVLFEREGGSIRLRETFVRGIKVYQAAESSE